MKTVNYSEFRSNLAASLDSVNDDAAPIQIIRPNHKNAVVISLDQYESYEETAYLLSSAENARLINKSLNELDQNIYVERCSDNAKDTLEPTS